MVFAVLGPFACGLMWVLPPNNLLSIPSPLVIKVFACTVAWIAGIILGIKAIARIENSSGRLTGREYAVVAIVTSEAWVILLLIALLLPMIYSVNS